MPLGRLAPKLMKPEPKLSWGAKLIRSPPTWLLGAFHSVLYLVFSTTIILANKHIITQTNFNCPIAVSSLGSLFGWVVSIVAVGTGATKLKNQLTLGQWALYVLPIGVCTALSLAFANIAYFYLSLSFIQMVKAFAPVVTFTVLVFFGLDKFDVNLALAIAVIVAGCFTASYGEVQAKSAQLGLLCMLICEVAEAFRSAGMQYLLAAKSFTLFDGLYYFSPATLIFLAALVWWFEWEDIKDEEHIAAVKANPLPFACAASLGFFVNLASLGVIQSVGSLTLKVISQLKNVVVIVAAIVLYDDVVTVLEVAGYAVAMFGFAMYQDAKFRAAEFEKVEMAAGARARSASSFSGGSILGKKSTISPGAGGVSVGGSVGVSVGVGGGDGGGGGGGGGGGVAAGVGNRKGERAGGSGSRRKDSPIRTRTTEEEDDDGGVNAPLLGGGSIINIKSSSGGL